MLQKYCLPLKTALLSSCLVMVFLGSTRASTNQLMAKCCRIMAQFPSQTPQSVLSFFYGTDYADSDDVDFRLRQGNALKEMQPLWFGGGGAEYDWVCDEHFRDVVRLAGKRQLNWQPTVDGLLAQMILCDQLARNIFRGSDEAYAYDEHAVDLSKQLSRMVLRPNSEAYTGEFYPPYYYAMVLPLMHSELHSDHGMAVELLDFAQTNSPPSLADVFEGQRKFEMDHKHVVDRFGRYPHRNKFKGRNSTAEELDWLADVENLPVWAKIDH